MKIKVYILATAVFCGAMTSCHGDLDTAPKNQVATGNMWATENLTDQGVLGVYANLRNWGIYGFSIDAGSGNSNGMGQWGFEILSPLGQSHYTSDLLGGSLNPGSGNVNNMWKRLYEGVHRANDAIANIPVKSPVSDEKKARLVAEARFLRAFFYYRLNELWRGVPYYDVPITIEECINGQETEEFIWGKVIEDLTACIAEPNLPDRDPSSGRATKGAAYALRGKVYMQQGKWAEAIADFEKVDDCGYGLFQGDYKALFTVANENSEEMIFKVENLRQNGYGSISQMYLGTRSAAGSCWGDHNIHPYAVDLYENSDGTPFDWDDFIPGYNAMALAEREVYFLRDKKDADGNDVVKNIVDAVDGRLGIYVDKETGETKPTVLTPIVDKYLPYGNEARIKAAYTDRDPRLGKNVITPYSEFLGTHSTIGTQPFIFVRRYPYVGNASSIAVTDGGGATFVSGDIQYDNATNFLYYQRKFVYEGYPGADFNRTYGDVDDPLIRYADVLLMMAEAQVELDKLSEAMALVKQVRDRVGMPTLAANFADQSTARNYVRDERRREMLGEGGSYFDELRWGTLRETKYWAGNSQKMVWGVTGLGAEWRWPDVYSGNEFVWPVPRAEIEKNPNLKPTPGWTY